MNKNLNLFIAIVFSCLCLSLFQECRAMEEQPNPEPDCQKRYSTAFLDQKTDSTGVYSEERIDSYNKMHLLVSDNIFDILKYAAVDALENGKIGKFSLVCKKWQSIFQEKKIDIFTFAISKKFSVDENTCKKFLNGRLIYENNSSNVNCKIEFPICDFVNPLEGTFDLSKCADTGKYLSISTGYRKRKKQENTNKVEIWLTPRFLVEKQINDSAKNLSSIFPVHWPDSGKLGVIWTWGEWDDVNWCDFFTTQDFEDISKDTLYHKLELRGGTGRASGSHPPSTGESRIHHSFFKLSF